MRLIDTLLLRSVFQLKIKSSIVLLKSKIYLELMLLSGGIKSMLNFQMRNLSFQHFLWLYVSWNGNWKDPELLNNFKNAALIEGHQIGTLF